MAFQRMKSEQESKPKHKQIRGFLSFTPGSAIEGYLTAAVLKENGTGFFLVQLTQPATLNVRDKDSLTGQAEAQPGEIAGVRKTAATRTLADIEIGTKVRVEFVETERRTSKDKVTGQAKTHDYHRLYVDVDYSDFSTEIAEQATQKLSS
jgi:hypothetical protein